MPVTCRLAALALPLALAVHAQPPERVLEFGFEQRVRNENWNNILDYNDATDDERGQIRYRTRLWAKAPLTSNMDFKVGLAQETNEIFQPLTPTHFDEVFFESAYFDFKKLFVKGLSLRFGRQDIVRGEGFLLIEGDPYDGSRSIYHNAAVLGYERGKSKFELIGISNPRTDRYLPRINNKCRTLVEWNELALGLYYTGNHFKRTPLEAYYFYKREFGDIRAHTNPQYQTDRYRYTGGGRAIHKLPQAFSLTGEFALQWGHQRPNRDIRGWAGYGYLKKNFGPKNRHYASFGYWGMSGDDSSTPGTNENWDPLFERWPKWSELYIYSQFRETGVAYWTNVGMWQAEAVYVPWKPLSLRGTYYHMNSYHPFPGNRAIFSNGTTRGDQYQARADLVLNKNWRGHVLYERLAPGNYYTGHAPGFFFRLEVNYAIGGKVTL